MYTPFQFSPNDKTYLEDEKGYIFMWGWGEGGAKVNNN